MANVYKYPLRIDAEQEVLVPEGARPLTVQMQGRTPCLWALVDPYAPEVPRAVHCVGTGHPADYVYGEEYLGTVQLDSLVFHFFIQPE